MVYGLKVQGGVFYEYFTRMHRKGEYPIFAQLQEDGSYIKAQVNETYDFKRNENKLEKKPIRDRGDRRSWLFFQ